MSLIPVFSMFLDYFVTVRMYDLPVRKPVWSSRKMVSTILLNRWAIILSYTLWTISKSMIHLYNFHRFFFLPFLKIGTKSVSLQFSSILFCIQYLLNNWTHFRLISAKVHLIIGSAQIPLLPGAICRVFHLYKYMF